MANRLRVPVILQSEASECGIACLAMVAGAYGDRRSLREIRGNTSSRGLTLDQIVDRADRLGFQTRAISIALDDLAALPLPAILHWEFRHFVVVVATSRRGITVHDPSAGRVFHPWPEASKKFTGVALEIWPAHDFVPIRDTAPVRWRQLLATPRGFASGLGRIAIVALCLEALLLATPFYVQTVVDNALAGGDTGLLTTLAMAFLVIVLLQAGFSALRSWMVKSLTSSLGAMWQSNLFRHLLKLPTSFFEKRHLGDILSRFTSMQIIQRTLGSSFVEFVMDGFMGVILLVLMISFYSPFLSLIAVCSVLLYLAGRLVLAERLREHTSLEISAAALQQTHSMESIRGIQSLRLFGGERARLNRWLNLMVDTVNEQLSIEKLNIAFRSFNRIISGSERILIVWIGAIMVMDATITIGMLIAFLAYRDQFSSRSVALVDRMLEFKLLRLHGERVQEISLTPQESPGGSLTIETIESIELAAVSFRYGEGERWVLKDLSLTVRRGETVAIVGPSGCGKTTLAKVILGLLDPDAGRVLVNGVDRRQIDLSNIRGLTGSVMQDDALFAGTISDNIAFFEDRPNLEQVRAAAKQAAIDLEVVAMPMGYDTLVGDMGISLSGGQKQRVLLARCLFRRPMLIVLDEATSHLDVSNERRVNEAVRSLGVARVVIAHRPETIAAADRVVVMEAGTVAREYRPDSAGHLPAPAVDAAPLPF